MFYRAGYIEVWGRGIQKIRDACKNLGAKAPEYIVHGEEIIVKFSALQSTEILNSKAQNVTKDVTKDISIEVKILALLKEKASITTTEMAERLSVNRRTIQRGKLFFLFPHVSFWLLTSVLPLSYTSFAFY